MPALSLSGPGKIHCTIFIVHAIKMYITSSIEATTVFLTLLHKKQFQRVSCYVMLLFCITSELG